MSLKVIVQKCDTLDSYIHILQRVGIKLVRFAHETTTESKIDSSAQLKLILTASLGKIIYEWEAKYILDSSPATERNKLKDLMELSGFVVTEGIWLQLEVEDLLSERNLFGEQS